MAAWRRRPSRSVGADEPLGERDGIGEMGEITKKAQLASREGSLQLLQKQAAEQPREDADRQEEAGPASDPGCAVGRRSRARAEPWHFGQCRLRQKLWGERRGREMVHRRSMKRMEVPHEPSQ